MIQSYNRILHSNAKEQTTDTLNDMAEFHRYITGGKKSDTKEYSLYEYSLYKVLKQVR